MSALGIVGFIWGMGSFIGLVLVGIAFDGGKKEVEWDNAWAALLFWPVLILIKAARGLWKTAAGG